eukprot:1480854-Alexandrium_andersonii.AAC.1
MLHNRRRRLPRFVFGQELLLETKLLVPDHAGRLRLRAAHARRPRAARWKLSGMPVCMEKDE